MSTVDSTNSFIEAFASILACARHEIGPEQQYEQQSGLSSEQIRLARQVQRSISEHTLRSPNDDISLIDTTDMLIRDFERNASSSDGVQQLVSLLSKNTVRNLFSIHDIVCSRSYSPQLPQIPYEVDDDDGLAVKLVRLVKGNESLGATLRCNPLDGSVCVARVVAGGAADRTGCIQVGDRVMEVNGVNVTAMSPAAIVKLLNSEDGVLTFKLFPNENTPELDGWTNSRHVRAMIDYSGSRDSLHPCPETALGFSRGEILQVVVTNDEHWWQARSLGKGAFASLSSASSKSNGKLRMGIIPSEDLHEKRRVVRDSDQKARSGHQKLSRTLSEQESLLYEPVSLLHPSQSVVRPIVMIGPSGVGRNELKKRLITKNCDRFAATVPHTSRPQRANEKEGIDYHFVRRDQMEHWIRSGQFLEFGEYNNNLYGTLCDSVLNLMKKGRVPVLTPHPFALRVLRSADFKPFIVFIKPPDFETLKETRQHHCARNLPSGGSVRSRNSCSSSRNYTNIDFEQMISTGEQLNQIYGYCFDMTIVNTRLDEAFEQLRKAVMRLELEPSWVPSDWVD